MSHISSNTNAEACGVCIFLCAIHWKMLDRQLGSVSLLEVHLQEERLINWRPLYSARKRVAKSLLLPDRAVFIPIRASERESRVCKIYGVAPNRFGKRAAIVGAVTTAQFAAMNRYPLWFCLVKARQAETKFTSNIISQTREHHASVKGVRVKRIFTNFIQTEAPEKQTRENVILPCISQDDQ